MKLPWIWSRLPHHPALLCLHLASLVKQIESNQVAIPHMLHLHEHIENIIPWKVLALAAIRSWSLYHLAIHDMVRYDTCLHKDVAAIHSCCRRLRRPPSSHYLCRSTLATGLSKSSCLRSEKCGNKHVKPRWKKREKCRNLQKPLRFGFCLAFTEV